MASSVGLYLPSIPNNGLVSNILYVFPTSPFILSCNISFNSFELYFPVASIKPPIVDLASSIVSVSSLIIFSLTFFFFNDAVNVSNFLGSVNLVKSPSNIKSFISL